MRLNVSIDAAKTTEAFKEARRGVNRATKAGVRLAGEKIVLPEARRRVPVKTGRLRESLIVRTSGTSGYLTTSLRGKQSRFVGLLEFGGTVRKPIRPRMKQALMTPWGPRAVIKKPRTYQARHFLQKSAEAKRQEFGERVLDEVLDVYRAEGFDIDS